MRVMGSVWSEVDVHLIGSGDREVEWKEVKWKLKFASLLFGSGIKQFDGESSTVKDVWCEMTR